jgi:heptosyltransferase II
MSKNKKILLLSLSGIGNHLMHSSVFRVIKEAWPESELTVWVAPRNTATLAKANPDIDRVIRAPIKRSVLGHMQQVMRLKKHSFDTAVILHPGQLWKGAAYTWLTGADQRIGHRYFHLGNPDSTLLLTDAVSIKPSLHDTEQNLALLKSLELSVSKDIAPYYLPIPKTNKAKACSVLKALRPGHKNTFFIGMHAGSATNFSWKRWPVKSFGIVGKKLVKQHGAHILIFGSSAELKDMKVLRQKIGKNNSSIILNKLLTTAAVIEHCKLFISNDSGLMHVASALDVPIVGLFGPTDEGKTGPRGKNSVVVRAPDTEPVYDVNTNFDFGDKTHQSMLAIKSEQVLKMANSLLDKEID